MESSSRGRKRASKQVDGTGKAQNSDSDTRNFVRLISQSVQSIMLHSTNEDFRRTNLNKLKVTNAEDAEIVLRNKFLELCGLEPDPVPNDITYSEDAMEEITPQQTLQSSNSESVMINNNIPKNSESMTINSIIPENCESHLFVVPVPLEDDNLADIATEDDLPRSEPISPTSSHFLQPSMKRCFDDDNSFVATKFTKGNMKNILKHKITSLKSLVDISTINITLNEGGQLNEWRS